jgi:hypothetical protein
MINTPDRASPHARRTACLPAVCCGVIVVCERSPLTEHLPYNEFIVWSDFDAVLETVEEVLNYDEYYNRIYGDFGKLNAILDKMENDGYDNLSRKIKRTGGNRRVVKLIVLNVRIIQIETYHAKQL